MKLTVCLLLTLAVVVFPASGEDEASGTRSPEAIAILEKVDAAVKAVDSVSYSATSEPSGVAATRAAPAKGKVVIAGWNGSMPSMFLVDIKTKNPETDDAVELTAGGNGDTFFLIDHSAKKAYEDMDPAVMGTGGNFAQALVTLEFVHDRPYDDELNAQSVELQGTETVGGEECHKIRVVYAGGQGESIWLFSTKDFLPRGRTMVFQTPEGEGSIKRLITDLKVGPEIDSKMFVLNLPEGYEQIDDFAP